MMSRNYPRPNGPKLYSYVVADDTGFSPNPYHGFCTLACCKPRIRGDAHIGDYVIGTASIAKGKDDGHVVYAMRVTEVLRFDQYWNDQRFNIKKPRSEGDEVLRRGDNIYQPSYGNPPWSQLESAHSNPDGSQNVQQTEIDTEADGVLISDDFVYFGGAGPDLVKFNNVDIRAKRNHRCNFDLGVLQAFINWFGGQEKGLLGTPKSPFGTAGRCSTRGTPRCRLTCR